MKQKHFFIGIGIVAEGIPNKDDDDETTTRAKALEVKSISAAQTKMLRKRRLRARMGFDTGRLERVVCSPPPSFLWFFVPDLEGGPALGHLPPGMISQPPRTKGEYRSAALARRVSKKKRIRRKIMNCP